MRNCRRRRQALTVDDPKLSRYTTALGKFCTDLSRGAAQRIRKASAQRTAAKMRVDLERYKRMPRVPKLKQAVLQVRRAPPMPATVPVRSARPRQCPRCARVAQMECVALRGFG